MTKVRIIHGQHCGWLSTYRLAMDMLCSYLGHCIHAHVRYARIESD